VANNGDPVRLLHTRSEHGYTSSALQAMPFEPEAVSADYQRELTQRAHNADRQRARNAWRDAELSIHRAVDDFRERAGHVAPGVVSGLRAVERAAEQVGRKLA
jgi:hypothetical protein